MRALAKTKRKEQSLLHLPPVAMMPSSPGNMSLAVPSNRRLTKPQRRVIDDFHTQALVIKGTSLKGTLAATEMENVQQNIGLSFHRTSGFLLFLRDTSYNKEHRACMDEFTRFQLNQFGNDLATLTKTTDENILKEVSLSLHPEPEPRSLLQKIFGW